MMQDGAPNGAPFLVGLRNWMTQKSVMTTTPHNIFIDGQAGTTGLQLRARLESRSDIRLLSLGEAVRKDPAARSKMLNEADISILCLPDDAAREAVSLIDNPEARLIDASTAHRTPQDWVYGIPELTADQHERIAQAHRVSNAGCYATASVLLIRPLVDAGLIPADYPLTINAVSGYSGGGRKMIESYEDPNNPEYTQAPHKVYGLGLEHKHTEEIRQHSGLTHRPLFVPSVGHYRQGMIVQVPLQLWSLPGRPSVEDIHGTLQTRYDGKSFVSVVPIEQAASLEGLYPDTENGTNNIKLFVFGNAAREQVILVGVLDNLGKGAAGQAVQNMNIMLGLPETAGLKASLGDC